MRLEELRRGMLIDGVSPNAAVILKDVESDGAGTVEVIFKDASGRLGQRLLFRSDEANLELVQEDGGWRFDGDGARFRLAAEARRIGSAYLFDPRLAVHTSLVDPYPHQISAVYEKMLSPALALPAGGRPRRGEDHHGRALNQGARGAWGPGTVHDRVPGEPR